MAAGAISLESTENLENEVQGGPRKLPNEAPPKITKSLPGGLWGGSWGSPAAKAGLERFCGGSWRPRGALGALRGRS